MRKGMDLTGQRFGRLEVLYLDTEPHVGPAGKRERKWICKCDCGNTVSVFQQALTFGNTQSCGCGKDPHKKDLTGQRFGKLEVLHLDPDPYVSPSGRKMRRWVCKCDCGNVVSVLQNNLTSKKRPTRSCGCFIKEAMQAYYEEKKNKSTTGWHNIRWCFSIPHAISCFSPLSGGG